MAKTKTEVQAVSPALSRVYMDIPAQVHMDAKMEALKAGVTLKAWLESLITAALAKGKKKA